MIGKWSEVKKAHEFGGVGIGACVVQTPPHGVGIKYRPDRIKPEQHTYTVVRKILVEKYFVFKKFASKIFRG